MIQIVRPINVAWMVFWVIMAVESVIKHDWFGFGCFSGIATWNFFRATREDVEGFW